MKKTLIKEVIDPYINFEAEICRLKKENNAVILAHYYQDSEIQDIADFVGDSLELLEKAEQTEAGVIVFCGVKYLAEAIMILNPTKKILVPDLNAGCWLEESCPPEQLEEFKKKYPDHIIVTHINCSAEVKALSDIIITTSNAEKIINSIAPEKEILFAPDKNLGNYLMQKTGRNMMLWNGSCNVHEDFSERDLVRLKTNFPAAQIIAHPQCPPSLLEYASYIGTSASLLDYVEKNNGKEFIVLTEPGVIHQMHKVAPNSNFYDVPSLNKAGSASCSLCPFMQLNTLEKIYSCMVNQNPAITIESNVMERARIPLKRMLQGYL